MARAPATSTACPTSSKPATALPDPGRRPCCRRRRRVAAAATCAATAATPGDPPWNWRCGATARPGTAGSPSRSCCCPPRPPPPTAPTSPCRPAPRYGPASRPWPHDCCPRRAQRTSDGVKGCPAQRGSKGDLTLPSAAVRVDNARAEDVTAGSSSGSRLLPTPRLPAARTASTSATTIDDRAGSRPEGQAAGIAQGVLPRELGSRGEAPPGWQPAPADEAVGRTWGPYAQAVGRWELLLGRPVPAPTQPGRHGTPVLAPRFVEWLMGLPAGWVTDLDLPRTLALRVLGNGVVPQQAAVALRLLLCPHRWAVPA